ncbi:hypothetical protein ACJJTC_014556 [Scirpophaga incertulas]
MSYTPMKGGAPAEAAAAPPPPPGASPGLLRRRYSVPETIMRKYRLAQQRSESDCSEAGTSPPRSLCGSCGPCGSLGSGRRGREAARRSALLRRLWARAPPAGACACACADRPARSLDGSPALLPATPKRQRRDLHPPDDMLRAALRNTSYGTDTRSETSYENVLDVPHPHRTEYSTEYVDTDGMPCCNDCSVLEDTAATAPSAAVTVEPEGPFPDDDVSALSALLDDRELTDTSETFSTSMSTAKETNGTTRAPPSKRTSRGALIDGRISERSPSIENNDSNILPFETPLTVDTPAYDMLEIVVSETFNVSAAATDPAATMATAATRNGCSVSKCTQPPKSIIKRNGQNINIDEYVSNILVESLNSLTDQLECMNASIGSDRKMSIVEKEIKVKLQNTGVNTIVHLSPTSNNPIIFGNEELYNVDEGGDASDHPRERRESVAIREDVASADSDDNCAAPEREDRAAVNRAVMHQIQRLFQDEASRDDPGAPYAAADASGISHIEISNVDVFIDSNSDSQLRQSDTIEVHTEQSEGLARLLSGVGAGNYWPGGRAALVPRLSALPHSDSMEVNASSDDADAASGCASLVDSLDDPNSPRSAFLRRPRDGRSRRGELVRSAVDILDLLPGDATETVDTEPHRGEAFFVRIKDDACGCDEENVVVADHMPEKIKQRLRRRQARLQSARRGRHSARPPHDAARALFSSLVDDLVARLARDELAAARRRRPARCSATSPVAVPPDSSSWRPHADKLGLKRVDVTDAKELDRNRRRQERSHVRGKLSLLAHPTISPDERGPKRVYQKSEIHEGNKCIEILEILEYVNGSQSSPETTNSDENQNPNCRNKKSRIPVPVGEKPLRTTRTYRQRTEYSSLDSIPTVSGPTVATALESRSRSNSLRFRRVFDSIPEEKSSLSVDSSNEDINHNTTRRASAPNLIDNLYSRLGWNGNKRYRVAEPLQSCEYVKVKDRGSTTETRSAGTSPTARRSQTTMTSPRRRSAATSPPPPAGTAPACTTSLPPLLSHRTASVSVE